MTKRRNWDAREAAARAKQARQQRRRGWAEGKEVVYYEITPVRRGSIIRKLRNFTGTTRRSRGATRRSTA